MDISLRQLEAFIKVAEHRSFSKAGDELFLSQSTISSHVAQLEQSLQVTLIKRREKKNIELTEEGQRAYRAAQIIINQAEMLQNMFRKEEADPAPHIHCRLHGAFKLHTAGHNDGIFRYQAGMQVLRS